MTYVMSWQPCIDTANNIVATSKWRGEPVLIERVVDELQRTYPGLLSRQQLGEIVRTIVIEKRWSMVA
jgi:hypothetical protein